MNYAQRISGMLEDELGLPKREPSPTLEIAIERGRARGLTHGWWGGIHWRVSGDGSVSLSRDGRPLARPLVAVAE